LLDGARDRGVEIGGQRAVRLVGPHGELMVDGAAVLVDLLDRRPKQTRLGVLCEDLQRDGQGGARRQVVAAPVAAGLVDFVFDVGHELCSPLPPRPCRWVTSLRK
jgi:hypothetical protein